MPRPTTPATLTAVVRRAALRGLLTFAIMTAILVTAPRPPATYPARPSADDHPAGAVDAPGGAVLADLVSRHDCWTAGQRPGAAIPGTWW